MRIHGAVTVGLWCAAVLWVSGCGREEAQTPAVDAATAFGVRPALCDRSGRDDAVRDLFCAEAAPRIGSLLDVQRALGILTPAGEVSADASVVLLGHSTALSGEVVSELNPRAIMAAGYAILAFSRGVQQLELVATDRGPDQRLNFYLLRFEQACNAAAGGCRPRDLYTLSVESGWLRVALEDDEDLKNTPSDCRQCHQRGLEQPILLMREQEGPWAHFFGFEQDESRGLPEPSGSDLVRDYLRAKGDEPYANLPRSVLGSTVGATLEGLVASEQPLLFDSAAIANELWPWRDGFGTEPERSSTWDAAYDAFKRGEQLPLPYFRTRVSDPEKQARLTEAYQRHRAGQLAAEDFPDFADIFSDEPQTRAEIGLQTEPDAGPVDVLIQACAGCHNDVLDQSISRAKFSVALGRMSRAELDLAIARLQLPRTAAGAMPPAGRRQIPAQSLNALVEYLRRPVRPEADDAKLERVAQYGMALATQSSLRTRMFPIE